MKTTGEMMYKKIVTVSDVTSEPGDSTRYKYLVYEEHGCFYFIPKNGFRYPQKISRWDLPKNDAEIEALAEKENCNFWTVKECVRFIKGELK